MEWIQFSLCAAAIIYAGIKLGVYGDWFADRTGLGGAWVGVMLLGAATSLPELVTSVAAVAIERSPNLALGNVLGSNCFNILILAAVELAILRRRQSPPTDGANILTGAFGITLTCLIGFGVAYPKMPMAGHVSALSIIILAVYALAMRVIYLHQRQCSSLPESAKAAATPPPARTDVSLAGIAARMAIASAVIVAAGVLATSSADAIAVKTGWGQTFAGNLLLAMATSLPELTVTATAFRLGSVGMGIGNLLGSCVFNTTIASIADFFYADGSLFANVGPEHLITCFEGCLLISIVLAAMIYRAKNEKINFAALAIIAVYLAGLYLILPGN